MRSGIGRLVVTATAVLLLGPTAAGATTITVNTPSDLTASSAGVCSLREAVAAANTNAPAGGCPAGEPGGNTILLAGGPAYTLTAAGGGSLKLSGVITIRGAGAASTTIDGGGIDRVLDVGASPAVSISGVTITGGRAPDGSSSSLAGGSGGGIRNVGALTLTDVTVSGNRAGTGYGTSFFGGSPVGGAGGSGGGVLNNGTLTIVRSTIAGNYAGNGGIGAYTNPPIRAGGTGGDGGAGGGIANTAGATLSVSDSSITANHAGTGGRGGDYEGAIIPNAPALMGGAGGAGGGLWNAGTVSISTSVISGNAGGGGGAGGSGNAPSSAGGPGGSGGFGGGVYDTSAVSQTITNGTIAANAAGPGGDGGQGGPAGGPNPAGQAGPGGDGGGGGGVVSAGAALTLLQMTISGNQVGSGGGLPGTPGGIGGGGGVNAFGSATLENTLIAGNSGGNCLGAMTDQGHNLSFPDATCPGRNADPKLGSLQDNGGPTPTVALGPGSAAIDQIPAVGAGCPGTDQRGALRPQGAGCDIGAYELGQAPVNDAVPVISGSPAVGHALSCTTGTWHNGPLSYAYRWLRGGVSIAGANRSTYTVTAADAARTVACRVTATNPTGSATEDSAGRNVPKGGGGAVAVSDESVSPRTFQAATTGPSAFAAKRRVGATVRFALSTAATVTFSVTRPAAGRRAANGTCVKAERSNRRKHRCTRLEVLAGRFTWDGRRGANHFGFTGRIGGRTLAPGTYDLVASPSAGGWTGRAVSAPFRILK